jgi:hypothetical protein
MTANETKWSERVREWKASGQTAKEFASGKDFKASTLTFWGSQLRRKPAAAEVEGAKPVRMVRVVTAPTARAETLIVQVGEAQVIVATGFDGALLRAVVAALGGGR